METSDSEYFESADEDFGTDQEDAVKNPKQTNIVCSDASKKISTEDSPANILNTSAKSVPTPDAKLDLDVDRKKEIKTESEIPSNESSSHSRNSKKPVGKKLGQKLGTKFVEGSLGKKLKKEDESPPYADTETVVVKHCDREELSEKQEVSEKQSNIAESDLWDESEFDWDRIDNNEVTNEGRPENLDEQFANKCNVKGSPPHDKSEEIDSGWGDWGGWNVSSIISTATSTVSTLTNHVQQGLNTVLETGIGIPDPEEMARITTIEEKVQNREFEEQLETDQKNQNMPLTFGLGSFVSGVSQLTKLVETTSTKVISGGLGTLETIGKKTMEVLQEGDPGLKKKRAFLQINQDKPILSQILREAKEKAEADNKFSQQQSRQTTRNYEAYFDDHQGLVHLEALELLSKQCSIKLQTILDSTVGESLVELQETLDQIKELCELPDEDEDEQLTLFDIREKLDTSVDEIGVPISYEKLLAHWEETDQWLNNLKLNICDETELHQQAIEILAQLTAMAVEQFHKSGELLLIKEHRSTADEADSLVQLTSTLTSFIGIVAAKFCDKLNTKAAQTSKENTVNSLITNVFFEAGNSSSYIQDAFQLLIPVLQVGAI